MPRCEHHEFCGLDANPGEDLCILHSRDLNKDKSDFNEAFEAHREKYGHNFQNFVFPAAPDFGGVTFNELANFSGAKFSQGANFSHATFTAIAGFSEATFIKQADFRGARFKWASFMGSAFNEGADFSDAKFCEGADFIRAKFLGRMLFVSQDHSRPIFSGAAVDFGQVIINPLDALIFRKADLQKSRFLHTDLRKAEFTDVKWPRKGGRFRVYDEDVELRAGETRQWSHIEQLYRQLKQNYEDRRAYERAGDFHYGEKEMRRRNPDTPPWLSCLLRLYRCVGGYGERCSPPLAWSIGLFVVCALLYLCFGLRPKDLCSTPALTSVWGYFDYSLRVMTLLKPDDLVPIGYARYVRYG